MGFFAAGNGRSFVRNAVLLAAVFCCSYLVASSLLPGIVGIVPFASTGSSSSGSETVSEPVYAWLFGYVGNTFYPTLQLNLSQQTMINTAKTLGDRFGKDNLVLLPAVDEIKSPGGQVNLSMIPTIKSYISSLKQYASRVYGRLNFIEFNLTGPNTVYNQSALYISELGLNGIWFDNAAFYYQMVGGQKFNQMMQNLTEMFPGAEFILNGLIGQYGYVVPLSGYTWVSHTLISPTPPLNSLTINENQVEEYYSLFPGHVLGHLDAAGPPPEGKAGEPMSIFANLSSSEEISTLESFAASGARPELANETFSTLFPVIGAWTYNGSLGGVDYYGTLYNSLSTGGYARDTFPTFERIMANYTSNLTITSSSGAVGASVFIKGHHYDPSSMVTVYFGSTLLKSVTTNHNGYFTFSFKVPKSSNGTYDITASDGINTLVLSFTVT